MNDEAASAIKRHQEAVNAARNIIDAEAAKAKAEREAQAAAQAEDQRRIDEGRRRELMIEIQRAIPPAIQRLRDHSWVGGSIMPAYRQVSRSWWQLWKKRSFYESIACWQCGAKYDPHPLIGRVLYMDEHGQFYEHAGSAITDLMGHYRLFGGIKYAHGHPYDNGALEAVDLTQLSTHALQSALKTVNNLGRI